MNNQESFSVEVPVNDPATMKRFQNFMDEYADAMNNYITETATKLGVSEGCASDIIYLRGRSRWTQAACGQSDYRLLVPSPYKTQRTKGNT